MVSNQVLGARSAAGLLILSLALSGCSHFRHHAQAAPEPTAAAVPAAASGEAAATPASDMTATEAALSSAPTQATPEPVTADASEVNPGAPMHYTVKKGDTLWGIASMYLKDPWLWPEVWIINPQVPNPHLIYPGDTLALAYGAGGQVQVRLESPGSLRLDPRLRSTALENAIPTIPYGAIAPFLSRPTVMTNEEIRKAPYVVGFRNMHQTGGDNLDVYIRNLSAAGENARYSVMHVGNPLVDPDDGKVVGYEGIYTVTALVRRPGDPAKVALFDLARETLAGDRLVSADTDTPLNFTPHPPASDTHGRIINAVDGTSISGPFRVVVINRGKRHGIDPGTVLAIDSQGEVVRDLYRDGRSIARSVSGVNSQWAPRVQLPNERSGTLLVFKTFDRVSYALVVGASDLIRVGDPVRNP